VIHATALIQALRGGSSLPLVFATDDGGRHVVRMRGAGDGEIALIVDWIALGLACRFDLPARMPVPVQVDAALGQGDVDPEVRELIERSHGVNLGLRYADQVVTVDESRLAALDLLLRRRIFLFDVLLLNIDRGAHNPNLLEIDERLVLHDFGAAMAVRHVLTGTMPDERGYLVELRRHVLFDEAFAINPDFALLGPRPTHEQLRDIVASVPQSLWDTCSHHRGLVLDRDRIADQLHALIHDDNTLRTRLAALATMPAISESDLKAQRRRNRDAFAAKWQAERGMS
jgi:hypothetical protein